METIRVELSLDGIKSDADVIESIGSYSGATLAGIATLKEASAGDLSFMSGAKYERDLKETQASVVYVPKDCQLEPKEGQLFLKVEHPSLMLARACETVARSMWPRKPGGIHSSAMVADSAVVHESAYVGPFCFIGDKVRIGANTRIDPGCVIEDASAIGDNCWLSANSSIMRDSKIGDRVRIHAGVVIGADGFGFEFNGERHEKEPQIGWVEIESDVEIGANSAIDRGRFGPTRVGEGTKIDNHVQVGHNVKIGKHCILCAQVGIAGSSTIEDFVVFGGRAGASGHLTIGQGAKLAGCSAAFTDLPAKSVSGGTPAIPLNAYQRITVVQRKLPELFQRVRRLESQLGKPS